MDKPTNMHKPMTKAAARKLLGVPNDSQLAKRLGLSRPSVCNWGRMVPMDRVPEIFALRIAKEGRGK